jgi:hypothetical protein
MAVPKAIIVPILNFAFSSRQNQECCFCSAYSGTRELKLEHFVALIQLVSDRGRSPGTLLTTFCNKLFPRMAASPRSISQKSGRARHNDFVNALWYEFSSESTGLSRSASSALALSENTKRPHKLSHLAMRFYQRILQWADTRHAAAQNGIAFQSKLRNPSHI